MSKTARFNPALLFAGVLLFNAPGLPAQTLKYPTPEPEKVPEIDLAKLYHLEWLTRPQNLKLKENVESSALGPWLSK